MSGIIAGIDPGPFHAGQERCPVYTHPCGSSVRPAYSPLHLDERAHDLVVLFLHTITRCAAIPL
jgi:hypothetical protein